MRAYLWTMFALYIIAFVSEIRKKPGHTSSPETHSSLVTVISMAFLTWTGYLLWSTY